MSTSTVTLSVLSSIALHPNGITPAALAARAGLSDTELAGAIGDLETVGFVRRDARGALVLGDEYVRLAFVNHASRPETADIDALLRELAAQLSVTAQHVVLDGRDTVVRHRVLPLSESPHLAQVPGSRLPAHVTAGGKVLLAALHDSEDDLVGWAGAPVLAARTDRSIGWMAALHENLEIVRRDGLAIEDEENEPGVVAVAVLASELGLPGAIALSAYSSTTPVDDLPSLAAQARVIISTRAATS